MTSGVFRFNLPAGKKGAHISGIIQRGKIGFYILGSLFLGCSRVEADLPNLYISDGDNVDVFDGSSLNTSFISINGASGLAFGPDGKLYAASLVDAQVYSYNAAGVLTGTFVPYHGDSTSVFGPEGMGFGLDGHLYIADITPSNVHVYDSAGTSTATLNGAVLGQPVSVAFDPSGQLYAVDSNGVERYDTGTGGFVSYIQAQSGGGSYVLNNPGAAAFSLNGDLFVLDISGASAGILKFTGTTFDGEIVDFSLTDFAPSDLIMGPDGKLYVSGSNLDLADGEVLSFNTDGSGELVYASGLSNPTFITFAIPEPSTSAMMLLGGGLAAIFIRRRRLVVE